MDDVLAPIVPTPAAVVGQVVASFPKSHTFVCALIDDTAINAGKIKRSNFFFIIKSF
jgi:hypothetical protein